MKTPQITIIFLLFLSVGVPAQADTVYLKNGRQLEGIVSRQTEQYIELSVDIGTIKFYRSEIARINYSSDEEKESLKAGWEKKSRQRQARFKEEEVYQRKVVAAGEKEIGIQRQGDHLFVEAVLNGKTKVKLMLDTGSSLVVFSDRLAGELKVDIKRMPADIKMTIADGREVSAKLVRLDTMKVQDAAAKNVDAAVLYQEGAFKDFDGLLGMSFLKFFRFEINLAKNKLILQELN